MFSVTLRYVIPIGFDVPNSNSFIMTAADNTSVIELNARNGRGMAFESPNVTLTFHPGSVKLEPFLEHLSPG